MTAPANTPAPEGDTAPEGDDEAAQQALADAAREAGDDADGDGDDDGEAFDADRARKKIEKANREAKSLRERIKALEPLAKEAEKRRQGEMTETQKLAEEKAELEVQLAELRTSNIRREAAEKAGLPSRFLKFITAADEDEALAQAKELAKELKSSEPEQRKPADLRQGNRGANNTGSFSPDDLLRQMARQR